MSIFAVGDIHGNHKALIQCLERSKFDKDKDTLIQLGDIADGWHEVYECVEELLSCKNLISLKGNHDDWFAKWIQTTNHPDNWEQGGEGTLRSYTKNLGFGYGKEIHKWSGREYYKTGMHPADLPETHRKFWLEQIPYFKDEQNNLFVHGGFNRHYTIEENMKTPHILWWDRDLFSAAMSAHSGKQKLKFKEEFKTIFIGHTQTFYWDESCVPMFVDKVINLDQGAGWNGKLTIMNVDTHEYWQSDLANDLYPGEVGRR